MNEEQWIEEKRGMISASNAYKLLGSDVTLHKYANKLIDEINGGEVLLYGLEYGSKGVEIEPIVINRFIIDTNDNPDEPNIDRLIIHTIHRQNLFCSLCSPDAVFKDSSGDLFGLEVKCKFDTPKNYDKSWQSILEKPNKSHVVQCQFSLWCSEHYGIDRWVLLYAHITEEDPTNNIELLPYEITPDQDMHQRFEGRVKECWSMVSDNKQSMV